MANRIAERIRREIERDQRQMLEEMQAQMAADLCARDHYVPAVPPAIPKESKSVTKLPAKYERVGRFYLYRKSGHWTTRRMDGTGNERWHDNKKAATDYAWRVTTREAEAERRKAAQHANG